MLDDVASILDAFGEDPAVTLGVLLGVATLMALALLAGVSRDRKDVRRRAAAGAEPGQVRQAGPARDAKPPAFDKLATYLESTLGNDSRQSRLLRLQLVQAGFFDQRAVSVFFAARIAGAVAFGGAGLLFLPFLLGDVATQNLWVWAAVLGLIGYYIPTFYLKRRIGQRVTQHRMGFPDFMDLMVVCAEAGLSTEAAIERVGRELIEGYPSLGENLYMVSLEMRAGKAFPEALERLGQRLGIEEASMLATLLQQSNELGTSLSQSLRVYSEEMRNKRLSRAEEKAYALPAKLVVPLMVFVFPVLIMTLMLPVIIRFSSANLGG